MNDPGQDPAVSAGTRSWRTWVRTSALIILLVFAIWAVQRNYAAIAEDLRSLPKWSLITAAIFTALAMAVSLQVWRALMAGLGSPLPVGPAAKIFFISQLGKYVPGTVWSVVVQMELGRDHRVPRRSAAAVGVLVLVIAGTAGLTVSAVLLPLAGDEALARFWWLYLVVPALYVGLHPRIVDKVMNRLLALVHRPPLPQPLGRYALLTAIGWQVVTWMFLGLSVWVLLVGIGAPPMRSLPIAVAGYALAYTLGMAAFILPAGAGVRDAVLIAALSSVVSAPTALTVALIVRCLSTLVDLLFAGIQLAIHRARH